MTVHGDYGGGGYRGGGAGDHDTPPEESEFDKMYLSYNKKPKPEDKGRTSFIPLSDSPGPAAYAPLTDSVKQNAPRAAFGTANRHNEEARYISELHNKSLPAIGNPGPGTYRTNHGSGSPTRQGPTPSWKFGTAEQRLDPETSCPQAKIPGPIYNVDLPSLGPAITFAPMGSLELGMQRSRYDDRRMFLSADHSRVDHGSLDKEYARVGPGMYDVSGGERKLSVNKSAPRAVFGKSGRDVAESMYEAQVKRAPLNSTAAEVPGPIYEYGSTLNLKSTAFNKSTQMYAPEKGASRAGPYLTRGHEDTFKGIEGPGPGCYDVQGGRGKAVGGLGDGPTYPFGVLPHSGGEGSTIMHMKVPGPGAYNPKKSQTSGIPTAPGYSIASNIRTDWADMSARDVPGPGAYNVSDASTAEARRPPAFSMGAQDKSGRASFIPGSCTPGPTYSRTDAAIDTTHGRGFSFGGKDKTRSAKSLVGIRYLGPLAANESLGTEGPGPVYDTTSGMRHLSKVKSSPQIKMSGTGREIGSKVFISQQHAEAEGLGLDSPGPGAYDHHNKELADVTSRFKKPGSAVFSLSSRFKSNFNTF